MSHARPPTTCRPDPPVTAPAERCSPAGDPGNDGATDLLRASFQPLLCERRELLSKLRSRHGEPALAGAFRDAEDVRDLLVRVAFHIVHDERDAVDLGQL